MKNNIVIDQTSQLGHICFFYSSDYERFNVLAQYIKQGLDNNELCIFVTADSQADAIRSFNKAGLNIKQSVAISH